jgi:hypothetical protein
MSIVRLGLVIGAGALLLASAALAQQAPPAKPPAGLRACGEPRPQICTKEFMPACGVRRDGTRMTYSNGCMACMDANVVGYLPGPSS